jgi:hypothetical protein
MFPFAIIPRSAFTLRVHDELAGLLAHAALQRVGLGQAARKIEAHQQLVQVAWHEGGGHLLAELARVSELVVVVVDQLLLQPHRVLLLDDGLGPGADLRLHRWRGRH